MLLQLKVDNAYLQKQRDSARKQAALECEDIAVDNCGCDCETEAEIRSRFGLDEKEGE